MPWQNWFQIDPGIELRRVLHAPLTTKEGEKSLEEKDNVGPDELEGVKKASGNL